MLKPAHNPDPPIVFRLGTTASDKSGRLVIQLRPAGGNITCLSFFEPATLAANGSIPAPAHAKGPHYLLSLEPEYRIREHD